MTLTSQFIIASGSLPPGVPLNIYAQIAKIAKMSYVQYMNNNNNNFSLIRNGEINRLSYQYILPQFFSMYKITERMKELNAFEDEKYLFFDYGKNIWRRNRNEYQNKYCNLLLNLDFDFQYCILGVDSFHKNLEPLQELYTNSRNDFILVDNINEIINEELMIFKANFDILKNDRIRDQKIIESLESEVMILNAKGDEMSKVLSYLEQDKILLSENSKRNALVI